MKLFKITLIILITQSMAMANTVPSNWFSLHNNNKNLYFENSEKGLAKFDKYVEKILKLQEEVLEDHYNQKSFSDWKFSGMKTDLSISKGGLFGITALKAKTAVELSWKNKSTLKDEVFEESLERVELATDMPESEVKTQLNSIVKYAVQSGRVKNESKLRKNLENKVLEVHSILKHVALAETKEWVPSLFRMDLSFGVSGNLLSVADLGGDFRLRLDWKIKEASESYSQKISHGKREKKFRKLMTKISADLTKASQEAELSSGYILDKVSFGFGASKKTIFSIAKSKASAVGLIFFKKTSKKALLTNEDLEGEYEFSDEGNKLFSGFFTRLKFRKGLKKSFKISDYFAQKAEQRKSHWVIEKIKTQFSLSYSGIFGLTGASGSTIAEVYYKKGSK